MGSQAALGNQGITTSYYSTTPLRMRGVDADGVRFAHPHPTHIVTMKFYSLQIITELRGDAIDVGILVCLQVEQPPTTDLQKGNSLKILLYSSTLKKQKAS